MQTPRPLNGLAPKSQNQSPDPGFYDQRRKQCKVIHVVSIHHTALPWRWCEPCPCWTCTCVLYLIWLLIHLLFSTHGLDDLHECVHIPHLLQVPVTSLLSSSHRAPTQHFNHSPLPCRMVALKSQDLTLQAAQNRGGSPDEYPISLKGPAIPDTHQPLEIQPIC